MGFYLSCKAVILRKSYPLKRLSMTTGGFQTYCAQSLAGLYLTGYQKKKCCENFIKKLTKCKHPTVFSTILRYSKIKKLWYIPFIKIICILSKVQIRLLFRL